MPSAAASRSSCQTASRQPASWWEVGSSASSTVGRSTSARASAVRCCWPIEVSSGAGRRARSRPNASRSRSTAGLRPSSRPSSLAGYSTFSRTLSSGSRPNRCGRKLSSPHGRVGRIPSARRRRPISPPSGRCQPPRVVSSVDLPEPDRPSRTAISPRRSSRSRCGGRGSCPAPGERLAQSRAEATICARSATRGPPRLHVRGHRIPGDHAATIEPEHTVGHGDHVGIVRRDHERRRRRRRGCGSREQLTGSSRGRARPSARPRRRAASRAQARVRTPPAPARRRRARSASNRPGARAPNSASSRAASSGEASACSATVRCGMKLSAAFWLT